MDPQDIATPSSSERAPIQQEDSGNDDNDTNLILQWPFSIYDSLQLKLNYVCRRHIDLLKSKLEEIEKLLIPLSTYQKKLEEFKPAHAAIVPACDVPLQYTSKSDILRDYRAKMAEVLYKINSGDDSKNLSQSDLKDESNSGNRHTSDELELARSLLAISYNFIKFSKSIDSDSSSISESYNFQEKASCTKDLSSYTEDLLSKDSIKIPKSDIIRRVNHLFTLCVKNPVPLSDIDDFRESLDKLQDKSIKPFVELYFDTICNFNKMWETIDLVDKNLDFPLLIVKLKSITKMLEINYLNFLKLVGQLIHPDKKTSWLNHLLKESKIEEDNKAENEEDNKAKEDEENTEYKE